VVNNEEGLLLLGTVNRDYLEKSIREYESKPKFDMKLLEGVDVEIHEDSVIKKPRLEHIIIQPTPIRFLESTPLTQIHLLFITLRLSNAFVTSNGKLKGVITRQSLREAIIKYDGLVLT